MSLYINVGSSDIGFAPHIQAHSCALVPLGHSSATGKDSSRAADSNVNLGI